MADRILIVDDEESVATTLAALLEREGYEAVTAATVGDALVRLEIQSFDVVLLDLMLGSESGLQVLARLRDAAPDTSAIVLSGYGSLASATRAIELGVSEYLIKPCPIDDLKAAVARAIAKRRAVLGARQRAEDERTELLTLEQTARIEAEAAQRRLRELFEAAPALIAVTRGPEHVIEIANEPLLALTGRPDRGAVIGRPLREAFPELAAVGYVALADQVYATGEAFADPEMPARRDADRDGAVDQRWTNVVIKPYRDHTGQVVGLLFHGIDVTAQVSAANALRRTNNLLEAIVAGVPLGIVALDSNGNVTLWNPGAEHIFGWRADEVLGRPLPTIPPDRAAEFQKNLQLVFGGSLFDGRETRRARKDGTLVDVAIFTAPVRDSRGQVVLNISVIADISERKRIERRQAELLAREETARRRAEAAVDRVARLQAVTAALMDRQTPEQVAAVVVGEAMGALGADRGALGIIEARERLFEVIQVGGYPDDARIQQEVDRWRRFPVDAVGPWGTVAKTGEPLFLASRAERVAQFPELAGTQETLGYDASAVLPLPVDGRVTGVLWLGFPTARAFDGGERAFLETLARHCTQALERARLDEAERRSRREAERAAERMARLQAVTAALASAATPEDVAAAVVDEAISALGARSASVIVLTPDGQLFQTIFRSGYAELTPETTPVHERWVQFPVDAPVPAADAVRRRELVILSSAAERAARYPHLAEITPLIPEGASVTVPLLINSHPIGALHLTFAGTRAFDSDDRSLLLTLGRLCAQAFERARLLTAEQAARTEAEAARRRATMLAELSQLLVEASLDEGDLLGAVCRHLAEVVGDGALISMREPEGDGFATVGIYHSDPEALDLARELTSEPSSPANSLAAQILRASEPILFPEIRPEHLDAFVRPDQRSYRERFGFHSLVLLPLRSRRETIGVLCLWRDRPGRPYTEDDVRLLQDLANRAAIALENARLFAQVKEAVHRRDEFLSAAAHELKTPLTGVELSAQLLLRLLDKEGAVDRERLYQRLRAIDDQTRKLGRLVNQLLDVSRIEAGRLVLDTVPTDLSELVRAVGAAAQLRSERHQITVRAAGSIVAVADPIRIEQVVTNLVENAIKYSPDGGPIEIAVEQAPPVEVAITVTDHGMGIAPEHRSRIFDRFFQAHAGKHFAGMGLGLFISQQIVELHGGSIHVASVQGEGATFTVRLPRAGVPQRVSVG